MIVSKSCEISVLICFQDAPNTREVVMANKVNKKSRKREKNLNKVKKLVQVRNEAERHTET